MTNTSKKREHNDLAIDAIHDEVQQRLSTSGQKYTKSRQKLVEALARNKAPATLPEIVADNPDLATSSVYRNLDILSECGVVAIIVGQGHSRFELAEPLKAHHHHLICLDCGDIADVHLGSKIESLIDSSLLDTARKAKFKPARHVIDLYGYCSSCPNK